MSDLVIGKRKALKLNASLWLNGSLRIEIEPYLCWDTIDKAQAIALIKHLQAIFALDFKQLDHNCDDYHIVTRLDDSGSVTQTCSRCSKPVITRDEAK